MGGTLCLYFIALDDAMRTNAASSQGNRLVDRVPKAGRKRGQIVRPEGNFSPSSSSEQSTTVVANSRGHHVSLQSEIVPAIVRDENHSQPLMLHRGDIESSLRDTKTSAGHDPNQELCFFVRTLNPLTTTWLEASGDANHNKVCRQSTVP